MLDLDAIFNDPDKSKKTVHKYKTLVRTLYKKVCGENETMTSLDWLRDTGAILNALKDLSPSTRRLYIIPLMMMLKHSDNASLYIKYQEMFQHAGREVRESQKEQTMSERDERNWVTKEDIDKKIRELKGIVDASVKHQSSLSQKAIKALVQHLCLCLYTMMPPLRNDFCNIKLMQPPYEGKDGKNYLLETEPGRYTLILTKYKTSKCYGRKEFVFPEDLNTIVQRSFQLYPRRYLLSKLNDPNEPMSHNYLSVFMSNIWSDKNVGSSLLRKLHVSEMFADDHTLEDRDELASQMLHSRQVAQTIYEKHHRTGGGASKVVQS